MTHKFAKYLILAIGALGLSALPALATTCGGGLTLTDGTVCTLGALTFDFESISFNPAASVDTLSLISPGTGVFGDDYVLDFDYLGDVPTDINLVYGVTSTSGTITEVDSTYMPTTATPQSLVVDVCGDNPATNLGACSPVLASVPNNTGALTFGSITGGPVSSIYVETDITNPGFSSFTNSFVATPEPSSIGFMLIGALGIVAASRKFRRA